MGNTNMSAIDVDAINPILKDIINEQQGKKRSKTEQNKRFSRIRAAIGRKAKRPKKK
jgi:6-phosphogluconate dehydrogenase (decarboxylating)